MKKLLIIIGIALLLISCTRKPQPIEKYQGRDIVVIREPQYRNFGENAIVRVKTKDSVFYIYITGFDAKNLKIEDTIK